jgi:2,3-bisphosphoglycerate-dependent phosphoglycerate mutase
MKLYLVRHAESANNAIWHGPDRDGGRSPDPELTAVGLRQAAAVAEHLASPDGEARQQPWVESNQTHFGLTHLFCSLMTRSALTASHIAAQNDLELHARWDLFEKGGLYELDAQGAMHGVLGPGRAYFADRFPDMKLPEGLDSAGWWNRPAEDEAAFIQRVKDVVVDIKAHYAHTEHCVGLVVHGDFIDQFINELTGTPRHPPNYEGAWESAWTTHNASISRIDFVEGRQTVVYFNRVDHLPAELLTW